MKTTLTIRDLAKRLNLSVSTVSYALNDGPKPVSDDVRKRVLAAADELNFRPNRLAKSLAMGKTHVLGVVPPSLGFDLLFSPFLQRSLNAVVNEAERHCRDLMLFTASDRMATSSAGVDLVDGRIDGAILIAPNENSPILARLEEARLPFAIACSSSILHGPCFHTDNYAGTRLGLDHLLRLGHRRIAYIAGRCDHVDGAERLAAFECVMAENGLEVPAGFVLHAEFTREIAKVQARRLIAGGDLPTAILCSNDDSARGVYDAFSEAGIRIPDDVSVVGFDDNPQCEMWTPALTTTVQPIEDLIRLAFQAVMDQIEGKPVASASLAPSFTVRHSTSILIGENHKHETRVHAH